jgi:hypothetical protein
MRKGTKNVVAVDSMQSGLDLFRQAENIVPAFSMDSFRFHIPQ